MLKNLIATFIAKKSTEPTINWELSAAIEALAAMPVDEFLATFDLDLFVSLVDGQHLFLSEWAWDFAAFLFEIADCPYIPFEPLPTQLSLF